VGNSFLIGLDIRTSEGARRFENQVFNRKRSAAREVHNPLAWLAVTSCLIAVTA
jgi:hypothetical protein